MCGVSPERLLLSLVFVVHTRAGLSRSAQRHHQHVQNSRFRVAVGQTSPLRKHALMILRDIEDSSTLQSYVSMNRIDTTTRRYSYCCILHIEARVLVTMATMILCSSQGRVTLPKRAQDTTQPLRYPNATPPFASGRRQQQQPLGRATSFHNQKLKRTSHHHTCALSRHKNKFNAPTHPRLHGQPQLKQARQDRKVGWDVLHTQHTTLHQPQKHPRETSAARLKHGATAYHYVAA